MKQTILSASVLLALVCAWNATPTWGGEHPEHPTATTPAAVEKSEHPEHPTATTPAAFKKSAVSAGLLDGKTFAGEIATSGEPTGEPEDFVFKDGRFFSSDGQAYGFNETAYTATEQGGVVSFTADVENAKGETMSWKGVVKGDQIDATALYQTTRGKTEYRFKGAVKAAKSKAKAAGSGTKPEHPEHPR